MIFLVTGVLSYYADRKLRVIGIIALFGALLVMLVVCAAVAIRHKKPGFLRPALVLVAPAALSLCISHLYFGIYVGRALEYVGRTAYVQATVTEVTFRSGYGMTSAVRLDSIDGERTNINAVLHTDFECDVSENDVISLYAKFCEFSDDEYGFPEKKYNLSKGRIISLEAVKPSDMASEDAPGNAHGEATDDASDDGQDEISYQEKNGIIISSGDGKKGILRALGAFQKKCSVRLRILLGDTDGGFASALLLGDRSGLDGSLKRDFGRLGLSHMLAISGMHLSVLTYALEKIITKLRIGRKARCLIMIPAIIAFAAITDFSMSVLRASLMLIIYYLGFFLSGERDSLTSLAVSCALICLVMPNGVLDCGLQLSFSATLGLITADKLMPDALKKNGILHRILKSLILTSSAVLFNLPLVFMYFGEMSLVSPLTNLLYTIPVTLVLYLSPLLLIVPGHGFIKETLCYTVGLIIRIIRYSAGKLASFPCLTISLTYDFTIYAVAAAVISAVVLLFAGNVEKKKRICLLLLPIVAFAAVFSSCLAVHSVVSANKAYAGFINYSKNDALVLKRGGNVLICDMSDGSYKVQRLAADLAKNGLHAYDIDGYMLTHYHKKHISSFKRLSDAYYIKTVLLPDPETEDERGIAAAIAEAAADHGCKILYYSMGDDGVRLSGMTIYPQEREYIGRSTHPLVSMRAQIGDFDITYAGSSEFETEENRELLCRNLKQSDMLIIGAHGPITKNSANGFEELLPEHVIASNAEIPVILGIKCEMSLDYDGGDYAWLFEISD